MTKQPLLYHQGHEGGPVAAEPATLQITLKSDWGNLRAYPANDLARSLASISGTKTLPLGVLLEAVKMGFSIETVGNPTTSEWRNVQ